MKLLTFSKTTDETINRDIGKPEYSYYFIWKKYLPAMERIGEVVKVTDPETEVDKLYDEYRARGVECIFLSFSPPDETPSDLRCPTVCVFAWEFSTIPDEAWDGNDSSNWVHALTRIGRALTLSSFATDVVKKQISPSYPIATVPAPVCRRDSSPDGQSLASVIDARLNVEDVRLEVNGTVIDSAEYEISFDRVRPINRQSGIAGGMRERDSLDTRELSLDFSRQNLEATQLMVGFYAAEDWGAWSRTTTPWLMLPLSLLGEIEVTLELLAHGDNVNKEITVTIGSDSRTVIVGPQLMEHTLHFNLDEPGDTVNFSGLSITQSTGARDHRTLGIGLSSMTITRPGHVAGLEDSSVAEPPRQERSRTSTAILSGVVYTSVLNPADGRKNWEDMLIAFCWAFREREDVTLVLKMTHFDLSTFFGTLLQRFSQLAPFKCRIIAIQGFLDDEQYRNLANATTFVVNSSYCEGQCLPLMEYMAEGIPAVAPDHTAMRDYISSDNAFVVDSNTKPTFWPNDLRRCYRALSYEINWHSLKRCFEQSYAVAREDPAQYRSMATAAYNTMQSRFSVESVTEALQGFLEDASDNS